jgi:lipopolysaccharide cholinephosphotransferase
MNSIDCLKKQQNELFKMIVELDKICTKNGLVYYLAYGTALGAVRHKGFIPWDGDLDIVVPINEYDKFCCIVQQNLPIKYSFNSIDTDTSYTALFARIGMKGTPHHLLHIDIFPLVGMPKSKWGRWLYSRIAFFIWEGFYIKQVDINLRYPDNSKKRKIAKLAKILLLPIPKQFFIWIYNKLKTLFPYSESEFVYNFCSSYCDKGIIPKYYYSEPIFMCFERIELPIPREWDKYLTHIYGDYMTQKKENYM